MKRTVGMLRAYIEQTGFFARIAKQLGLDPSYISRWPTANAIAQELVQRSRRS
jgi:hypothetical protein